MSKVIRPVNIGITRYYRTYVTVDCDMPDEDIQQKVRDEIVENQGIELQDDPDLDIEEGDIVIRIDNAVGQCGLWILGGCRRMKTFTVTITEDMIRDKFDFDIRELEEDGQIEFDSEGQRDIFLDDCVEEVLDKYETYGIMEYAPDYEEIILDMAETYGIAK